jgi:hypothetical protein
LNAPGTTQEDRIVNVAVGQAGMRVAMAVENQRSEARVEDILSLVKDVEKKLLANIAHAVLLCQTARPVGRVLVWGLERYPSQRETLSGRT